MQETSQEILQTAPPEDLGLSSERLARIDEHLKRRYLEPRKIAGALTVVARAGEVVYVSPVGMQDLERSTPMAEDTIFRIYSMSKPITSIALMMLYEHGHFSLEDPVHRFIPAWRDLGVYQMGNSFSNWMTRPVDRPMTVRDLLTHTSGLTYGFMERTNVDAAYRKLKVGREAEGGTLQDMVDKLAGLPLEFSPGTRWNYSVATDICGHLVEVISGMRFDRYLQQNIFDPLGMVDTAFYVPPEKIDRFAACYNRRPDKALRLQDDPVTSIYTKEPTFFSGGGGLVSTAADYLRFCTALMNGGETGGVRLVGRKTLELMVQNHLPGGADIAALSTGAFSETTYEGIGFGLGFSVTLDTARAQVVGSPGEFAWGGAASTVFWIDPVEELIVIFMTQFMPSRTFDFRRQLKQLIYGAIID